MAYTESVGMPSIATAQPGDVWMRLPVRQPHIFHDPPGAWFGLLPEAAVSQTHLAKRSAQNFDSQWVDPVLGNSFVHNQSTPSNSWVFQHRLQLRTVDITVVRALADWHWDGSQWVDPQATTRPVTIVWPRDIVMMNSNTITLNFARSIAGVALVRR